MFYRVSFLLSLLFFNGCEATTYEREPDKSQTTKKNPNPDINQEIEYIGTVTSDEQKHSDFLEGKNLYHKCAGCHGLKGEKKALGKSELIGAMSESEIVTALKDYRAGTRDKHGMGQLMKGQVSTLSDQQILNIARYMQENGISEAVINGRNIYGSKLRALCQMDGIDFAKQHTQKEWENLYNHNKFVDEVYNICPTTKDIVKSSDEKDLYSYIYYYSSK